MVVAGLISLFTLAISITLLFLYYKGTIDVIEVLLYSFATQTYNISFIGSTITPFFFVSAFFLISTFIQFHRSTISFTRNTSLLLSLPILSSLFGFICYTYDLNSFYYIPNGETTFFLKPIYFYTKNYLPLFGIVYILRKKKKTFSFERVYSVISRIAYISALMGLFQVAFCTFTDGDELINRLVGNKFRYIFLLPNGLPIVRVSALFSEPKLLAAFLGLALPILVSRRSYGKCLIVILAGILTLSQTFMIACIVAIIGHYVYKTTRNTKSTIFIGILLVWGSLFAVATFKDSLVESSLKYTDTIAFTLTLERALDRYQETKTMTGEDSRLAGIPLQQDLEWPVVKFLRDRPLTLLTGYGPGNSIFLQPKYFEEVYSYDQHKEGLLSNHMNMRWFFYTAEFGLPIFLLFMWILTSVPQHQQFANFFYSFLWLFFFFNEIDLIIIMFYTLFKRLETKV
ncbi:hypothetical protein JYG30_11960 [Fibrella sp. USSR17]